MSRQSSLISPLLAQRVPFSPAEGAGEDKGERPPPEFTTTLVSPFTMKGSRRLAMMRSVINAFPLRGDAPRLSIHDVTGPAASAANLESSMVKVIGAGFGRTGTHSMKSALELLGFGPCHHMVEVLSNPGQAGQVAAHCRCRQRRLG